MLKVESNKIMPNGTIINIDNHNIHIYSEGDINDKPTLVFMSGSATVAPVYDFKPLYSKLSKDLHIVVVERLGYGYSEIYETPRDVETMLSETRKSLQIAGEEPPYVLMPHSISGIEALYWVQQYPDEISAIIGLDMAVPEAYDEFDFSSTNLIFKAGRVVAFLGLHRTLSFLYPYNQTGLTSNEIKQQDYLMYRNAVNKNYIDEGRYAYDNAQLVTSNGIPKVSALFFVSNGKEAGDYWIPAIEEYAHNINAKIVYLNCGHYVHYYESDTIAEGVIEFISEITN